MKNAHFLSLLLAIAIACRPLPEYTAQKTAFSEKNMIVAAHPLAVDAGLEIFAQGGNAVDAAIAVQFALAVVCPRAGNIGGGGFLVLRTSDGQTDALDYREKAPLHASNDMY
ncbi:gamma-glutamyltransferase, partial [Arthrospira platensis SPKY1]|nr:gamma-glutamyltransferase [Arthrospira platensis SPKY1]